MKLHELSPAAGSARDAYRKGRGPGSGNGKTAGKGHKGQNARSGGGVRPGFEGQDKEHIAELIEYYCNRRKSDFDRNRDSARRISLNSIDAEKYPKVTKRIAKFSKNGKENLVKFL